MGGVGVKETLVELAEPVPAESQSCVSLLAGHGVLSPLRQGTCPRFKPIMPPSLPQSFPMDFPNAWGTE